MIRSQLQEGVVTLPKSLGPERMKSNIDVFDYELTADEIEQIRKLDETKHTVIHDPDANGVAQMLLGAFVIKDSKQKSPSVRIRQREISPYVSFSISFRNSLAASERI